MNDSFRAYLLWPPDRHCSKRFNSHFTLSSRSKEMTKICLVCKDEFSEMGKNVCSKCRKRRQRAREKERRAKEILKVDNPQIDLNLFLPV